jgi:pyruvate formate lyase activating enzyme
MYVRSIEGPSTIDWVGRLVAVVYTQGCNFNCPYCQNAVLIPPKHRLAKDMSPEDLLARIDDELGPLINGVLVTGGEPTLQEDLIPVLRTLSEKHDVCMDTNGSNPDVLMNALPFLKKLDIDAKVSFERYKEVGCKNPGNVKESFVMAFDSHIPVEVRTTVAYPLVSEKDLDSVAQFLSSRGFSGIYVIQQYDPNQGVRPAHRKKLKQPPLEDLYVIAKKIKETYGLKVALRSRYKGYAEL